MYKYIPTYLTNGAKLALILTSPLSLNLGSLNWQSKKAKKSWQNSVDNFLGVPRRILQNIVHLPPPLWWLGGLRGWAGWAEGSGAVSC